MTSEQEWIQRNNRYLLSFLFFFSRIILFLTLVPYGYYGIGDLIVYREWTALPGWPYLDYWVEYPPLFPFLSEILFRIAGEQSFLYDFLMALVLALAGSVTLYLFQIIASQLHGESAGQIRSLVLFGIFAVLPYTWWYADSLILLLMMAGIWSVIQKKDKQAGLWIGLGILAKWFPLFLLPALIHQRPLKNILKTSGIALTLVLVVFAVLYGISPEMTMASLSAQPGRSSWQTVWALIDGNLTTGAYLTTEQRLDPSQSAFRIGNPPVIPPLLTLPVFCSIGIILLARRSQPSNSNFLLNVGVVWIIFLLWSPGWSSQWVLYLLPLVLLTLPIGMGVLFSLGLVTIHVIEFPFLLGRYLTQSLWITIPIRILLLIIILIQWLFMSQQSVKREQNLPQIS
ncbi:MAG: glycosyltransferase 87 family protein [Bellilinea sp.]